MGRWQWGLPCSRVLTRRDEKLARCCGAWMEVGGRMTECSGAGVLEERLPPSAWTVASLLVWISLPSCIKLHSVMSKGKAISCGSELHTQGVPCCYLITNFILGHRLPDTTMPLSSHRQPFWVTLRMLIAALKMSNLCQGVYVNDMITFKIW